jgi:hypothetical protein
MRHLNRLAIGSVGTFVLLAATPTLAQSGIAGVYTMTLSPADLKGVNGPPAEKMAGTWIVTFTADGTYSVRQNNTDHVKGTYTSEGDEVTMTDTEGDFACKGDELYGVYRFQRDSHSLRLTKIKDDECAGRAAVLTLKPFSETK